MHSRPNRCCSVCALRDFGAQCGLKDWMSRCFVERNFVYRDLRKGIVPSWFVKSMSSVKSDKLAKGVQSKHHGLQNGKTIMRKIQNDHTPLSNSIIREVTIPCDSSKTDWFRISYQVKPFTAIVATVFYWVYFAYRLKCASDASESTSGLLWALAWIVVELGLTSEHI